jgi:hypothetical protein
MNRELPEQKDFIDYAEGRACRTNEVQRQVLQMLATSPELRKQVAELKKDIYLVNAQIPEFEADPAFAQELRGVAEAWLRLSLSRRFAFPKFLKAKEFFALVALIVAGIVLLVFLLLSAQS